MPRVRSAQAIACRDIWFGYNEHFVLRGLNLELAAGEIGVLFGRSGAGKTTLLRCVAGYERLTKGLLESTTVPCRPKPAGTGDDSRRVSHFLALQEALSTFDVGGARPGCLYCRPAEAA